MQQPAHEPLTLETGVQVPAGRPILGSLMLWEAGWSVKPTPIGIGGSIPHGPTKIDGIVTNARWDYIQWRKRSHQFLSSHTNLANAGGTTIQTGNEGASPSQVTA